MKTLKDAHIIWVDRYGKNISYETYKQYHYCWTKYIKPNMGHLSFEQINYRNIERMRVNVPKITFNRMLTLINRLHRVAFQEGWTRDVQSPTMFIDKNQEVTRKRILSRDEMRRIGVTIADWKSIGSSKRDFANLLLMYFYTGCRKGELIRLAWKDVDFQNQRLVLPKSKTETNKVIDLPEQAVELLISIDKVQSRVFNLSGAQRLWDTFRKDAVIQDVRLHDLRRTFISIGLQEGLGLDQLGKLVGHSNTQTTHGYAYLDATTKHAMLDKIVTRVEDMLNGETKTPKSPATLS